MEQNAHIINGIFVRLVGGVMWAYYLVNTTHVWGSGWGGGPEFGIQYKKLGLFVIQ